jgi:hypothetical protein
MTTTLRLETSYELHRNTGPEVAGAPKTLQALVLRAAVAFDGDDQVALSGLVRQGFMTDSGESGLRAGDLSLAYSHRVRLPEKFELTPALLVTLPISYYAQLASNISAPGIIVTVARANGDLAVSLSAFARYYWDKYVSSAALGSALGSGETNVKFGAGGSAAAEYTMPFLRLLSVGLVFLDVHSWFYGVGSAPASSLNYGATVDQSAQSPVLENFGIDAHLRVASRAGALAWSVTVGVGNTTAWEARLGGGIPLAYLGYADVPDVYVALAMAYGPD